MFIQPVSMNFITNQLKLNIMFIQPVSMNVTEEQYQEDLKEKLLEMGYKEIILSTFDTSPTLVTNYIKSNSFTNLFQEKAKDNNRYFIDHYNPELFLALAAMTTSLDGNVGEWWMCTCDSTSCGIVFNKGGLYKQVKPSIYDSFCLIDNNKDKNGLGENLRYFRKATVGEIINYFTKQKTMAKSIDERFPFVLDEENYKRILKVACEGWQLRLVDKWGLDIGLYGKTTIDEQFYKEMRKACTAKQHELFDKIFGQDETEWSLKDAKDGEPVWVRDHGLTWLFRYADGKGSTYNDQYKSGGSSSRWRQAMKFDPNNLPVNF